MLRLISPPPLFFSVRLCLHHPNNYSIWSPVALRTTSFLPPIFYTFQRPTSIPTWRTTIPDFVTTFTHPFTPNSVCRSTRNIYLSLSFFRLPSSSLSYRHYVIPPTEFLQHNCSNAKVSFHTPCFLPPPLLRPRLFSGRIRPFALPLCVFASYITSLWLIPFASPPRTPPVPTSRQTLASRTVGPLEVGVLPFSRPISALAASAPLHSSAANAFFTSAYRLTIFGGHFPPFSLAIPTPTCLILWACLVVGHPPLRFSRRSLSWLAPALPDRPIPYGYLNMPAAVITDFFLSC